MGWTSPRTWATNDVMTRARLNSELSGNLLAIGDHTAFLSYTPVLTASSVNPTLGSGSSQVGWYLRTGNIVHYWVHIAFGTSGTAAGTGTYYVSLPIVAHTATIALPTVGTGRLFDDSGSDLYVVSVDVVTGSTVGLFQDEQTNDGTVTAAAPFAWAASDIISGNVIYRAA